MIEIPEALTIANQINNTIIGKQILNVSADYSPHKFAWYYKDPEKYHELLEMKFIDGATAYGGMVNIRAGNATILISDGVAFRYHKEGEKRPKKHQLLLELSDHSAVSASVQMYGGIWCFNEDKGFDYQYYNVSKEKPSILSDEFNKSYFEKLISLDEVQKLSVKAFIATEQRIPGLGNGVLQDILWRAKIHPKNKINKLTGEEKENLYNSIKEVLLKMIELGGRDTEKDFFGKPGGYVTRMSKNTLNSSCTECGNTIKKENYLGGSIYYCDKCQCV